MTSQELIPADPAASDTAEGSSSSSTSNNGHGATPQTTESDNDDFDQLDFLTLFIRQPNRPDDRRPSSSNRDWLRETEIRKEKEAFKSQYLELIDIQDRASNHHESLSKAMARRRTPTKLQIDVKPMVVDKDDPDFVASWNKAIKECENRLIQTILNHLGNMITKTNLAIRATTKEAYNSLKTLQPAGAAQAVKDTLEEAEIIRKEKAESRKRKRTDKEKEANNKRAKKDN